MSIEAMRQALEALKTASSSTQVEQERLLYEAAIKRLRNAIDEATLRAASDQAEKPRQWQRLAADEIWQCNTTPPGSEVGYHICMAHQNVLDFAEAIEAKLKEKNT